MDQALDLFPGEHGVLYHPQSFFLEVDGLWTSGYMLCLSRLPDIFLQCCRLTILQLLAVGLGGLLLLELHGLRECTFFFWNVEEGRRLVPIPPLDLLRDLLRLFCL